ncbi:MAG: hypothetical protein NTU61_04995 [Candidatus Altiarchaeota archaeon]|nr:hypothetical protein [Candidatus Altiarchaeota archaeon]
MRHVVLLVLLSTLVYSASALSVYDIMPEQDLDTHVEMGLQYNRSEALPRLNVTVYLVLGGDLDPMERILESSFTADRINATENLLVTFKSGRRIIIDKIDYYKVEDKDFNPDVMENPNTFVILLGGAKGNIVVNRSLDVSNFSNYSSNSVWSYNVTTGLNAYGNKITVVSHQSDLLNDAKTVAHEVQNKVYSMTNKVFETLYSYGPMWVGLILSLLLLLFLFYYLKQRSRPAG